MVKKYIRGGKIMAKFDKIKVGDRVYDIVDGWGIVEDIKLDLDYPIHVRYPHKSCVNTYTLEGKYRFTQIYPSLFWNEVKLPTDEEDKKPFDLVEFLRDSLEPKDFEYGKENFYIYYSPYGKRWCSHITAYDDVLAVYFKKCSRELIDKLDDNKVTPQQLKDAYKILGWL